jgi:hydrogenase maturation protease
VLSAADLLGHYPDRPTLIGCQPLDLENWGGPLTPKARAAIDPAIRAAVAVLNRCGVPVRPRAVPPSAAEGPLTANISHAAYERPLVGGGHDPDQ